MFTPSKMFLVKTALPGGETDRTVFNLLMNANVQFVDFDKTEPAIPGPGNGNLEKLASERQAGELKAVEDGLFSLRVELGLSDKTCPVRDDSFLRNGGGDDGPGKAASFCEEHASLVNRLNGLKKKGEELVSLRGKTAGFRVVGDIAGFENSRYLFYRLGSAGSAAGLAELRAKLEARPVLVYPFSQDPQNPRETRVLVTGLKSDLPEIDEILKTADWRGIDVRKEFSGAENLARDLDGEIRGVEKSIAELSSRIAGRVAVNRDSMAVKYWETRFRRIIADVKSYFRKSGDSVFMSFWVPAAEKDGVIGLLRKSTGDRCFIEGLEAGRVSKYLAGRIRIPILYENPPVFRPFELFVRNFGLPAYGTIDPTPVFSLTYILMFGFMFADIGQGLVLGLAGVLMALSGKPFGRSFSAVIAWAGLSSAFFGSLFGSFFGFTNVFRPLWMSPMRNIDRLLEIAIGWGACLMTVGLLFNLYNSLKAKDAARGIFSRFGLLGGIIYWSAMGFLVYGLVLGHRIDPLPLLLIAGTAALLLFFRGPLLAAFRKDGDAFEGEKAAYFPISAVEIFEMITGYLANTVSFVRVAAFTLSHIGLFAAVFTIAGIVSSLPPSGLWSWVVVVLGNAGIILLEGLIVGIQSLRLEYYEFFTKFFDEGELEFKPVRLVGKIQGLPRAAVRQE